MGNRALTLLSNVCTNLNLTDMGDSGICLTRCAPRGSIPPTSTSMGAGPGQWAAVSARTNGRAAARGGRV
jgi:hypothetical protein